MKPTIMPMDMLKYLWVMVIFMPCFISNKG